MENILFIHSVLFFGAALSLVGILSSLVASRFGAPLILVFLGIGMLVGQEGPGGIVFNNFELTYFIGSLALAIILFDGGLRTKMDSFRSVQGPAMVLATLGVLISAGVTAIAASWVLGISFTEGVLVGAIVSSTDAAAVFFLLRAGGLKLQKRVVSTLEIESGTNDPIAVLLTFLLVGIVAAAGTDAPALDTPLEILNFVVHQVGIGTVTGVAGGLAMTLVLNRLDLPAGLHPLLTMAGVVLLYAFTVLLDGSGFLAVYLAGLVVGNRPVRAMSSIVSFFDAVTWLCQMMMFTVLGLLVTPSELVGFILPGLVISLTLMFIARPLAVFICLSLFNYTLPEKMFVSWVGLRGAVSIFLAAIPTLAGVPNAEFYFNIAFIVVFISLAVQGWSITPLARQWGLDVPRTTPLVRRIEIDLPGQLTHELVGYGVSSSSPILVHRATPVWARQRMVVREGEILSPEAAGQLKAGDYSYYLAPIENVAELDRLFAVPPQSAPRTVLATFPLRPDVNMAALAVLYGLEMPDEAKELSVSQCLAAKFDHEPAVGDRLTFGNAVFVVRRAGEGKVLEVDLEIEVPDGREPPAFSLSEALRNHPRMLKLWITIRTKLARFLRFR
jgi:cell volume regulation protein A